VVGHGHVYGSKLHSCRLESLVMMK